jgi:hypothetical protein
MIRGELVLAAVNSVRPANVIPTRYLMQIGDLAFVLSYECSTPFFWTATLRGAGVAATSITFAARAARGPCMA